MYSSALRLSDEKGNELSSLGNRSRNMGKRESRIWKGKMAQKAGKDSSTDGLTEWAREDLVSLLRALAEVDEGAAIASPALVKASPPILRVPLRSKWARSKLIRSCSAFLGDVLTECSIDGASGDYRECDESDPSTKEERKKLNTAIDALNRRIASSESWKTLYVYRVKDRVVYMVDGQAVRALRRVDQHSSESRKVFGAKASLIIAFLRLGNEKDKKAAEVLAKATGLNDEEKLSNALGTAKVPPSAIDQLMKRVRPPDKDLFPQSGLLAPAYPSRDRSPGPH